VHVIRGFHLLQVLAEKERATSVLLTPCEEDKEEEGKKRLSLKLC
jgi:hypothetical protein